jgi:hypothetical protein
VAFLVKGVGRSTLKRINSLLAAKAAFTARQTVAFCSLWTTDCNLFRDERSLDTDAPSTLATTKPAMFSPFVVKSGRDSPYTDFTIFALKKKMA